MQCLRGVGEPRPTRDVHHYVHRPDVCPQEVQGVALVAVKAGIDVPHGPLLPILRKVAGVKRLSREHDDLEGLQKDSTGGGCGEGVSAQEGDGDNGGSRGIQLRVVSSGDEVVHDGHLVLPDCKGRMGETIK